jgi:hypothetical protein
MQHADLNEIGALPAQFEVSGFVMVPEVMVRDQCDALTSQVEIFDTCRAGSRTLLDQAWCVHLATELRRHSAIAAMLPVDVVAVQCTLFDKSPAKNWLVALHQDLSIPVKRRVESAECSGWSEKEGYLFVQPPAGVLEEMVAVRVHVDACPAESGALRLVPGSHMFGRLDSVAAKKLKEEQGEVAVPVSRGGALVMRPLLLHASSKATGSMPRRVLHFVFGPRELPLGLEWRHVV